LKELLSCFRSSTVHHNLYPRGTMF